MFLKLLRAHPGRCCFSRVCFCLQQGGPIAYQHSSTIPLILKIASACYSNRVKTYEIIGWIGTVLVLSSYILLASGMIHASLLYHAMVGLGSIGVGAISYKKIFGSRLSSILCSLVFRLLPFYAFSSSIFSASVLKYMCSDAYWLLFRWSN